MFSWSFVFWFLLFPAISSTATERNYPAPTETPQNLLENIFAGFNQVFVVEMNDEGLYGFGQLGGLLRARYCDPKIRGITKTDGLTFRVREILERAKATVAAGVRKL